MLFLQGNGSKWGGVRNPSKPAEGVADLIDASWSVRSAGQGSVGAGVM